MTPMTTPLIPATVTGSLPKPGWLAQTQQLWPQWRAHDDLDQAKADATLLWVKLQEDIGINIVGDGEQARQHFVHRSEERRVGKECRSRWSPYH